MGDFSFLGNADPGSPESYNALEMRRRIAMQMMGKDSKKGYPKTLGEGLASIGDSIGEIGMMRALAAQEDARNKALSGASDAARTGGAPPPAAPPQKMSYAPAAAAPPVVAAINSAASGAVPAAADIAPEDVNVDPGLNEAEMQAARAGLAAEANLATPPPQSAEPPAPAPVEADAAPDPAITPMVAPGYRPAPAYLQAALDRNVADPERRAYLGHLASKEAQSPGEVSSTGAKGPFQFTRGTGGQYGLVANGRDMRSDLDASVKAADRLTSDNAKVLARGLGRDPSPGELALAHQQGAGTAVKMLSGTGNAPAGNLAVNNAGGLGGGAAANKIMSYYGMPGSGSRDAVAAQLASQAQPMTANDASAEKRFADVVGMSKGETGAYAYPPTAMARTGDVVSDAPNVTGISPAIGAAAGDTMQQRNDITRSLLQQQPQPPVQEVPQPNPTMPGALPPTSSAATGSPPEAADNRPIMTDIAPRPPEPMPAPGAQMAAAQKPVMPPANQMPPAIPPAGTPPTPVPSAPSEPRVAVPAQFQKAPTPPALPDLEPKSQRQQYNETMLGKAVASGDPALQQIYKYYSDLDEKERQANYQRRVEQYKAEQQQYEAAKGRYEAYHLETPRREQELKKMEDEAQQRSYQEGINRMLGGVPQEVYIANLNKSKENVAAIPAATQSIQRARELVDKMYHGPFADTETFLAKVMGSSGFAVDPRATGTEQFKTAMAGVMAQARKGIVGPGAQSEGELALLQKSTAADAKLTPETIRATLDAAERLNLQTALNHQQQVRRFAGETDPNRQGQVYGAFGMPNMADLVPQSSVNKLFKHSDDPKVHADFDNTYHTPGLSREVLRFRRPQ